MKTDIAKWSVMLSVCISVAAFSAPKGTKKAVRAPARKVTKTTPKRRPEPTVPGTDVPIRGLTATEAANVEATQNVSGVDKDWVARLQLSGGFGSVGTNDTRETEARSATGFNRNAQGALDVGFMWGKYLGAALEGYYGTGSSKTYASVDKVSGLIETRNRSLKQSGGNFEVQGRYSINHLGRDWDWHVGVGYGTNSVTRNAPVSEPSTVDSATLKASGPYASVGLQVLAIPNIAVTTDFAFSFAGSANYSTEGTTAASTVLDSGNFNRFRLGIAYVLSPSYQVGLQYVRREIKGQSGTSTAKEKADQFVATLAASL